MILALGFLVCLSQASSLELTGQQQHYYGRHGWLEQKTSRSSTEPDVRKCMAAGSETKLKTGLLYTVLQGGEGATSRESEFVWCNRAPPRVQFFGWLVSKDRLQCKENLLRKKIVDSATCDCCRAEAETTAHVLFHCLFAKQFWNWIGIAPPSTRQGAAMRTPPPGGCARASLQCLRVALLLGALETEKPLGF